MKNDRFLLGIMLFIVVLVVVALALFFTRGTQQSYLPETSPEAIVHNFALAVAQSDFNKAYGYLAEGDDKPTTSAFRRYFSQNEPRNNAGLRVGETELLDDNDAIVFVMVIWPSSGPFDSGSQFEDRAFLVLQEENWKIQQMPYPYWDYSWFNDLSRPD